MSFFGLFNRSPIVSSLILEKAFSSSFYHLHQKYIAKWQFFLGDQWETTQEDGVSRVTLNYSQALLEKIINSFMINSFSFEINKMYLPEDVNDREFLITYSKEAIRLLNRVWSIDNDKDELGLLMAQSGVVLGDVYVLVGMDPTDLTQNSVEITAGDKIKLSVLHPAYVEPEYSYYDVNQLNAVNIIIPTKKLEGTTYTEDFTKIKITKQEIEISNRNQNPSIVSNPLGFIPIIHIPNNAVLGSFYGKSDLDMIMDINREYNERASDISGILDYAGQPITIVQGASVNKIRSGERIWGGIPPTAKIFNLELTTDLRAHVEFQNLLKNSLHELSGVPENALGKEGKISNTSGVALQIGYMPLLENIKRKQISYRKGIKKINQLIFNILQLRNGGFAIPPGFNLDMIQPVWSNLLPKDQLMLVQQAKLAMEAGIYTKRRALEVVGEENIDILLEELKVEEEVKAQKKLEMLQAQENIKFKMDEALLIDKFSQGKQPSGKTKFNQGIQPSGFEPNNGIHKAKQGN